MSDRPKDAEGELERLLRQIIKSTESHIDGRDLLKELHPRKTLDIKRRVDGVETWFEGDWLSNLYEAVKEAREFLEGPRFVTVTACDWNGYGFDGMPFEPFPQWLQMAMRSQKIELYRDDRDYAVWSVETPGGRVLAYPGDQIHNIDGKLVLSTHLGNRGENRMPDPLRKVRSVGHAGMGTTPETPHE